MKRMGIVETDDIVIGEVKDIIKYLKRIENEKKKLVWYEENEKELEDIKKTILELKTEYISNELIYLKRNWNQNLVIYYLDTDLL